MIIKPKDKFKEFKGLRTGGLQKKGLSTGFTDLDENIKLAKGYMAIFTGVPSSGKSEFLDAILVNMSIDHGWKTMYYSPENHPIEQHMSKIAEKYIGKHITQFTEVDIGKAMEYMEERFSWIYPENPKLDTLINLANEEVATNGLDCFVLDPWNAVTHSHGGQMIHEYLAEALGKVMRFTRDNHVLACIVAHPTKPQADKNGCYPVPDLYSISDGAMWRNRADYGVVVHRPDMSKNAVEVYVGKVKYKWMGKVGMKEFDYNYTNGRFKGKNESEFVIAGETESAF